MIQLTQKGKEVYGDKKLHVDSYDFNIYMYPCDVKLFCPSIHTPALTPSDIKALLDMCLIEIK